MKIYFTILLFIISIFIYGCSSNTGSKKDNIKMEEQIFVLNKKIDAINAQLEKQKSINLDLLLNYELTVPQYKSGVFSPSSKGYQVITTEADDAKFLVSLKKITKYVNGYKLEFAIGNPGAVVYQGLNIKTEWGNNNSNETIAPNSILPGQWNNVTVILSPATADDISKVTVSLSVDSVDLFVDNRRSE